MSKWAFSQKCKDSSIFTNQSMGYTILTNWKIKTIFVKGFLCVYRDNHMAFIFQFFNVLYYIDWFADIEESLPPWDKAHLVMMYDLLNMLLDSICYNFVKNFCIYVHQWYWPVVFFFCDIFVRLFCMKRLSWKMTEWQQREEDCDPDSCIHSRCLSPFRTEECMMCHSPENTSLMRIIPPTTSGRAM